MGRVAAVLGRVALHAVRLHAVSARQCLRPHRAKLGSCYPASRRHNTTSTSKTGTSTSTVWGWGACDTGALGLAHSESSGGGVEYLPRPIPVECPELSHQGRWARAAAGVAHTALVAHTSSGKGQLLMAGTNSYGQLGFGDDQHRQQFTVLFLSLCAQRCFVLVAEQMFPYGGCLCSCVFMLPGLRLPPLVACTQVSPADRLSIVTNDVYFPGNYLITDGFACALQLVPFFDDHDVLDVDCGRGHTVVLTDKGVFACGLASLGQCGVGKAEPGLRLTTFQPMHLPETVVGGITQVLCGFDHTLLVTGRTGVLACGWGADGQTGQGHLNITATPTAVDLGAAVVDEEAGPAVDVVSVSTSADTCFVLLGHGQVVSWGNSEYGQTGLGSKDLQVPSATAVRLPHGFEGPPRAVAAGGAATCILDRNGRAYCVGHAPLLGVTKTDTDTDTDTESDVPPPFTPVDSPLSFVSVHAGGDFFIALTEDGAAYTWGCSTLGRLGLGSTTSAATPKALAPHLPGPASTVACGFSSTVAILAEPGL
eukprot:m.149531 g.149531  ORF g.149531 m.149531 type:complete len:537 (-) comp17349_c0_seq4:192-1802(-)